MSPRLRTGLALAGSFALGGGLLWVALRGADLGAVAEALKGGAWGWLVPLALTVVTSVVLRAWRWALLLDTLPRADGGPQADRTPLGLVVASVLIGYLVNLAVPRLGEVVRSGNVVAKRPVSLAGVVGTVVAERVLDLLMLVLSVAAVALLYGERLGAVAAEAARGARRLVAGLPAVADVAVGVAFAVAVVGAVAVFLRSRRTPAEAPGAGPGRLAGLAAGFRDGALGLVRTGRPAALVLSTLGIWVCYAAMSWFPLLILRMTAPYELGPVDAFALMTVGAVGMTLPAPGGVGSFHYATIETLLLVFAVARVPATTYAVLGHTAQLLFYAVAGVGALVWQGTGIRAATEAAKEPADPAPRRVGPPALAGRP